MGDDRVDTYKHSRQDLEKDYGLTGDKARRLCEALEEEIPEHWTEKKYNKHWYDNYFYSTFRRLVELVRNGYTIPSATQTIAGELENPDNDSQNKSQTSTEAGSNGYKDTLIKQLQEENYFLKEQLKQKDQQIQQLLPGTTNGKGFLKRIWKRIW